MTRIRPFRFVPAVLLAVSAIAIADRPGLAYLMQNSVAGSELAWDLAASAPNVVGGKVTYYIDATGVTGVTATEFAAAVRRAVKTWEDVPGASIRFVEDPSRPAGGHQGGDRVNRFGFSPDVLPYGAHASAFTTVQNGKIVDVDITFNPDMLWSVGTPGTPGYGDVQAVATHEWGHGLGLNHVPLTASCMYFEVVAGSIRERTLAPDDEAALAHLYPAPAFRTDFGTIRGRVDVAGTTNDRGVQVTAIDFVTGLPGTSAVTALDGSYAIEGLRPGVYRLVATPLGTSKVQGFVYGSGIAGVATTFLPSVRGQDGALDGSTGIHIVAAGETLGGCDLTVAEAWNPLEPDDAMGDATALSPGESACARIESAADIDTFSFTGTKGQRVSAFLHARQLGAELDARLALLDGNGAVLAESGDILVDLTGPGGADRDARILDFVLPSAGTYFLRVREERAVFTDIPEERFYVLTLLPGGGPASPLTSEVVVEPSVLDAGSAQAALVLFRPRSLTGGSLGSGMDVTMVLEGAGGVLSPVADEGDGTYTVLLSPASQPGTEVLRALVGGQPVASALVRYRGPVDFAASDLASSPRRIRCDGASTAQVAFIPRDAQGIPLGAGRSVTLRIAGAAGESSLGDTTDHGDGTYAAVLRAGSSLETVTVTATVGGVELDGTLLVGIGFPVEEVRVDCVDSLARALAGDLPARSVKSLKSARDLLAPDEGVVAVSSDPLAVFLKVSKLLEKALKTGAPVEADLAALAEAAREAALRGIVSARPLVDTEAEGKRLAMAEKFFGDGDLLLDAGMRSRSISKFRAAIKLASQVQP